MKHFVTWLLEGSREKMENIKGTSQTDQHLIPGQALKKCSVAAEII